MQNIDARFNSGTPSFSAVGNAGQTDGTASAPEQKQTESILSGKSLVITSPAQAAVIGEIIQSANETAMNTVKNMVDTPEERQRKIEQRERDDAERLREQEELAERDEELAALGESMKDELDRLRHTAV